MTLRALIFAYRKPGTTHAQFREHWENVHIPLVLSIAGSDAPLSHTRHYIHRTESAAGGGGPANPNHPATVMIGAQDAVDYDAVAELVFEGQEQLQAFQAKVGTPDAAAKIAADEEKFADRARMCVVMVGETTTTKRE